MELFSALFRIKQAPLLTRARVCMGYCNNVYDTGKIRKTISYKETPIGKGVKETVDWWKANGYL